MSHSKSLRVLHIEDSEADSALIEKCLQGLSYSISLTRISGKKELKVSLGRQSWDLILADCEAGGIAAADSFSIIRKNDPDVPFILVSRSIGDDKVAELLRTGIEDVVLKSRLERLTSVVRRALREHDIRNKEAIAHRKAFEAFAAKEQMLAIVSHDIKNPLSAVQLEAQSMLKAAMNDSSHLAGDVRLQAGRILKMTERLKTLISDLLDNNKGENSLLKLTKSEVDPSNLFYEVVDGLRILIQEKQIVLETCLPEHGVLVPMDRNKMYQVFSNLLTNALKFTPYGGTIRFELEEKENEFILSFTDSGGGLPVGDTSRLFEKYWTGQKKEGTGTGLGLFICKTIVEGHGGRIDAENVKGGGAKIWFTLPKNEAFTQVFDEDNETPIMIIDDDDDLREVITWALAKEGYAIRDYKNAAQALNLLNSGKSRPGLILVDENMEGMKGHEFLQEKKLSLLAEVQQCPAMLISGAADKIKDEIDEELYDDILEKPLDLEGLIGKVKKHFEGRRISPS
jgi:signal transduction histidine kinase